MCLSQLAYSYLVVKAFKLAESSLMPFIKEIFVPLASTLFSMGCVIPVLIMADKYDIPDVVALLISGLSFFVGYFAIIYFVFHKTYLDLLNMTTALLFPNKMGSKTLA